MGKSNFIELGIGSAIAAAKDTAYWFGDTDNLLQNYRDPDRQVMANWIRFFSADARTSREGQKTGCMEMEVLAGWTARSCDDQTSVGKEYFRGV